MPPAAPLGGDLLARRYRLIDRVGAGGMSVVWRARDEVLDRLVSVKWLGSERAGGHDVTCHEHSVKAGTLVQQAPHRMHARRAGEVAVRDGGGKPRRLQSLTVAGQAVRPDGHVLSAGDGGDRAPPAADQVRHGEPAATAVVGIHSWERFHGSGTHELRACQ